MATATLGLHSVTLVVREAAPTLALMAQLGWRKVAQEGNRMRTVIGHGGPGRTIDIVADAGRPEAVNGVGTVHHVAMSIGSIEGQRALRETLLAQGYRVTEIRDRTYFTSIYFREPGGVLFEVATLGPGFTVDEPLPALGTELKLPPWKEPHRADLIRALPAIRAGG
ncbi:MAG: hypothetical protein FJW27_06270 [Acidimicrobiia bacterium]|nr:hypothetical protein [Acidimicrobiia bacterium]